MNREAAARGAVEDETSRHCSYAGDESNGVVLHSAKMRNTVFLQPGRASAGFLRLWGHARSRMQRDILVESYFV